MEELHFNMGDVKTSYLLTRDNLELAHKIPATLKYSCQFWAAHLKGCQTGAVPTSKIATFMQSKLLYWLEVMGIEGLVGQAAKCLETLIIWSTVRSHGFVG